MSDDGPASAAPLVSTLIAQMWGRHGAEMAILRKAYYDDLTGLPNRRLLEDRIGEPLLPEFKPVV